MSSSAYPPPPPPPAANQKKPMSGCLIAILVVLGLFMVGGLVAALGIYRFSQSEEGQKVFGVVGETIKAQADAMDAPGTAEMKAAGCGQAMVMDLSKIMQAVGEMEDKKVPGDDAVMLMVNCITSQPELDCDAVKDVYLAAVPTPAAAFLVQVTEQKFGVQTKPRCQQVYAPDGTKLDIEVEETPDF